MLIHIALCISTPVMQVTVSGLVIRKIVQQILKEILIKTLFEVNPTTLVVRWLLSLSFISLAIPCNTTTMLMKLLLVSNCSNRFWWVWHNSTRPLLSINVRINVLFNLWLKPMSFNALYFFLLVRATRITISDRVVGGVEQEIVLYSGGWNYRILQFLDASTYLYMSYMRVCPSVGHLFRKAFFPNRGIWEETA